VLSRDPDEFVYVGGVPQRFIETYGLSGEIGVWAFHFNAFPQVYKWLLGALLKELGGQEDHLDC
jgi:hypothetical protein